MGSLVWRIFRGEKLFSSAIVDFTSEQKRFHEEAEKSGAGGPARTILPQAKFFVDLAA